jgi:CRISPR-associated exonuclease Cas4
MHHITATLINYFQICPRECWLAANNINMEQTSDTVAEGRLIGEHTYPQRNAKYTELQFDGIKIDFYDHKNRVVHEIKKSNKAENAHIAQVKYYLYILAQNGIEGATGLIEYPKLRKTSPVTLTPEDTTQIEKWLIEIRQLLDRPTCPPLLNKPVCKNCSYQDFCYAND